MTELQQENNDSSWFSKNKRWIYPAVWFLVGLSGGNADRIWEYIPESPKTTEISERVDGLDERVSALESTLENKLLEVEDLIKQLSNDE